MTMLVTPQEFAFYRGVDLDPTDIRAEQALEHASGTVQRYTERSFLYHENDEIQMHGSGSNSLTLPEPPIVSVDEVVILDDDDTEQVVEPTDYRIDAERGILWRLNGAWWPYPHAWDYRLSPFNVRITYTHGYESVPADVQGVVMSIAARIYARSGQAVTTGVRSAVQIGSFREEYDVNSASGSEQGLAGWERVVLDNYRFHSIG